MIQHMRKIFVCFLCVCSVLVIACTAQAASSRLPEEVLDVLETKWPDWQIPTVTYKSSDGKYIADNTPASYYYDEHGHAAAFAVLSKDGRNRLVILEKKGGTWKVVGNSTSAVFQGKWIPFISCEIYGQFDFYYSYHPYEEPIYYVFERKNDGHWYLTQYDYSSDKDGRVRISVASDCLTYKTESNGNKSTKVYGVFANQFSQFSLSNLPLTISEARTALTNPPKIPSGTLTAERIKFSSGKKYPVYQGPGKEYGRAANGKASVSTNDWIQVFGEENGYIMIQYDISKNQYRIGWIESKALPSGKKVVEFAFQPVQGFLPQETHLTDDPLNSEKVVLTLTEGTTVKWLASMGDWAYVETTSGTLIRGFVPKDSIAIHTFSEQYDAADNVEFDPAPAIESGDRIYVILSSALSDPSTHTELFSDSKYRGIIALIEAEGITIPDELHNQSDVYIYDASMRLLEAEWGPYHSWSIEQKHQFDLLMVSAKQIPYCFNLLPSDTELSQEAALGKALQAISERYGVTVDVTKTPNEVVFSYYLADAKTHKAMWRIGVTDQDAAYTVHLLDGEVILCKQERMTSNLDLEYDTLCAEKGAFFTWNLEDKMHYAQSLPVKLAAAEKSGTHPMNENDLVAIANYGFCLPTAECISQDDAYQIAVAATSQEYGLPEGWEAQSEVYYSFFFKPETGYTWRVIFWKTGNASYPSGVVDLDALTGDIIRIDKNGTMPNENIPWADRI